MYDHDNYDRSDGLGGYRRQRGEAMRPAVEWALPEGGTLYEVAATDTYSQFLVQYCEGDVVDANLSPIRTACSTTMHSAWTAADSRWAMYKGFSRSTGIRS